MTPRSVVAVVADTGAVGFHRVVHPLTYLARHGTRCRVLSADAFAAEAFAAKAPDAGAPAADVVVIQRQHDAALLPALERAAAGGATVVYELDDDLHGIPDDNPTKPLFGAEVLAGVDRLIRASHGVTVSTPELAAACTERHPGTPVVVVPNGIDFDLRDWSTRAAAPAERRVVVGWAGGATHVEDLRLVQPVVRGLLRDRDDVDVAVVSTPGILAWIQRDWGLDPRRLRATAFTPFPRYPATLASFDIGLAPLADTAFNACKSELRVLEYGAWGTAVVASPVAPYARAIEHGESGLLARTPAEWRSALDALLDDPARRARIGARLQQQVRDGYDLGRCWRRWPEAWAALAASRAGARRS